MNAAGFDLGTYAGWASLHEGNLLTGLIDSEPSRFESRNIRFVKFEAAVIKLFEVRPPKIVFFEEVRKHKGMDAAHVYGGYLSTLTSLCLKRGIEYMGVPVGTIKKHATGRGSADKDLMLLTAKAKWPEQDFTTHDIADAAWCLDAGLASLKLK